MTQPCPLQTHAVMQSQKLHQSDWRDDGACSYCGSISPERFFKALEEGCKLTPTDKNYKVYLDVPEPKPDELQVTTQINFDLPDSRVKAEGWLRADKKAIRKYGLIPAARWFKLEPRGPTKHVKFYMEHLDEAGKNRLITMINDEAINFAAPGYFYVLPFFVTRRQEPDLG